MAPLSATVYEQERLRCNLCGEVFTAPAPDGVGSEKYDETAHKRTDGGISDPRTPFFPQSGHVIPVVPGPLPSTPGPHTRTSGGHHARSRASPSQGNVDDRLAPGRADAIQAVLVAVVAFLRTIDDAVAAVASQLALRGAAP